MAKSDSLRAAKKVKQDEFYTQLTDIERELKYYRKHFKGKIVFCNCDDPFESNFFKYFVLNFNKLGLKKLIATSYVSSPIAGSELKYHIENNGQMSFVYDSDDVVSDKKPYKAVVTTVYDKSGNDAVEMLDVAELFESGENELTELEGDGDFRSNECIELLKQSDIVVTNPPFSLFREYVAQLMKYDKKFVIIGSQNAVTYSDIFPLLRANKIWLGIPFQAGNAYFYIPESIDGSHYAKGVYDSDARKVKFRNCCWFTNLDIKKRHEELILVQRYSPEKYPKYDNFDAINVSKTVDIPCDYDGIMGVPVTFMDKYNPDQFELIGLGTGDLAKEIGVKKNYRGRTDLSICINGKYTCPYNRILIRNKHPEQPKGDNK